MRYGLSDINGKHIRVLYLQTLRHKMADNLLFQAWVHSIC